MSESRKRMREEMQSIRAQERAAKQITVDEEAVAKRNAAREREIEEFIDMANAYKWSDTKDRKGNFITNYDDLAQKADRIIMQEVTSINDWRACMSSLLALCMSANKAYAGSVISFYSTNVNPLLKQLLWDGYDTVVPAPKGLNPETPMPSLQHYVHFSEDNTLQVEPLVRSDNGNTRNLNTFFKEGVVHWLGEQNYIPDPEVPNGFVHQNTNVKLTKPVFDELKANAEHGLAHFLSGSCELSFEERPSPSLGG